MTPTDLRTTLRALGLTDRGLGLVVGVTARTVRRWKAGTQDIPLRAVAALDDLQRSHEAVLSARMRQRDTDRRYRPLDNPAPVE